MVKRYTGDQRVASSRLTHQKRSHCFGSLSKTVYSLFSTDRERSGSVVECLTTKAHYCGFEPHQCHCIMLYP